MSSASTFHSDYSTNGHGSHPLGTDWTGPTNPSANQAHDEVSGMVTTRLTREEADYIYERRRDAFKQDPAASVGTQTQKSENTGAPNADGRPEWIPIPMSQLPSDCETIPWLWGGYIARGYKTSFTGLWKSGKTTLLKYLLKSMDGNETAFCGLPVAAARVLVVSEETKRLWAGRRDEVGLADHVQLIALPFRGRPPLEEWLAFMVRLEQLQVAEHYDLIVFDSMHNLWGVTDENKNAEVLAYLTPLNWLTERGAALLLIAHPSKGDAGEGRATRGGGAWGGFVDLILEMRRHDAENRDDTRRVLTAYSRWDDTPGELVIELDKGKGEYTIIGTKADARAHDRMSVYLELLPIDEPGKTPEEIRDAWPQGDIPRPGIRTITRDLDQAAIEKGSKIRCSGEGVRGKPKRYSILDT